MPLHIVKDDLTTLAVDAIVNPTNSYYDATGGLDLAVHRAAGEALSSYLATLPPLAVGEVRESEGFLLPCRYILHTVGPLWQGGGAGEETLLGSCYQNALRRADALGCESVAFPLIASGALGYPKEQVMKLATAAIAEFLCDHEMAVYLSVYHKEDFSVDCHLMREITAYISSSRQEIGTVSACCERIPPRKPPKGRARADFALRKKHDAVGTVDAVDDFNALVISLDRSFADELFYLIDKKGISDVECYKRSNVDKKTFSKIKCNKDYRPSKVTAVSFAIGLHLSIAEAERLLSTAGLCLSPSYTFDVIIRYFLTTGRYDTIFDVNEVLYQFDQITLGTSL